MLSRLTEGLASGAVSMHSFCATVRAELGPEALANALLVLHGGDLVTPGSLPSLLAHAQSCQGTCSQPGCAQMRGMLAVVRTHCVECAAPEECATCQRWAHLRHASFGDPGASALATPTTAAAPVPATGLASPPTPTTEEAGPLLAVKVARERPSETAKKESIPALMLLARSALGDITTTSSAHASPRNSPSSSPRRMRKRPKMYCDQPAIPWTKKGSENTEASLHRAIVHAMNVQTAPRAGRVAAVG